MSRLSAIILILIVATAVTAQSPQPQTAAAVYQPKMPWAVSVVHTIDVQKMVELMRNRQNVRVGVAGAAPPYIYNITTGLVLDDQGHVVTRLTNLDLQDKQHKLTVTTSDGTQLDARLIGVDCATGFAVLEVASLKSGLPKVASAASLSNGVAVKILSSDVIQRSTTSKVYLTPSMTVTQGRISLDSIYSRARGAMTLLSDSLLARSDGSVVITPDDQVVGMAQYAGYGRAYVYPIETIRDVIARRVIEKNDSVPAGWLGMVGDSVAQLSDADAVALGLQRKAGVIVKEVSPQGPASEAGLLPHDVITGLDDFEIAGTADLKAALSPLPAGRAIKLRGLRNQKSLEVKAVLGPRPLNEGGMLIDQALEPAISQRDQLEKRVEELKARHHAFQKNARTRETVEAMREIEIEIRQIYDTLIALQREAPSAIPTPATGGAKQELIIGMTVEGSDISFPAGFTARNLAPQMAERLQARGGVWVTGVAKDSAADKAGLKAGDVIVGVQDRVLLNAAQLMAFLANRNNAISLRVVRSKQEVAVNLNPQ